MLFKTAFFGFLEHGFGGGRSVAGATEFADLEQLFKGPLAGLGQIVTGGTMLEIAWRYA